MMGCQVLTRTPSDGAASLGAGLALGDVWLWAQVLGAWAAAWLNLLLSRVLLFRRGRYVWVWVWVWVWMWNVLVFLLDLHPAG